MAEPSKRTRTAALVLGLLVVVLLAYVDAQLAVPRIITASIVLGPLIAALACSSRQVTVVAAAAVAAAMLSPLWVTDPFSFEHLVQQLTVILGSGLAILAAMSRERHAVATKRLNLIAAIAGGDRAETFEQSAQRIVGRLVPEAADLATIDVAREAGPTRLAVRIDHPDAARLEAAFVERSKRGSGPGGITALSWEEPSLVTITDEMRTRAAFDAGDLEVLRAIDAHSYVIAPMRSRGKVIGALGLAYTSQSGRVYGPEDLAFAQSLADRIALALDNAGLSAEVSAVERRFRSALDVMGAAVLLQEPGRGIVYANDEAAQAFGLPDAEGVVRSSPEEIALSWLTVDEDGEPLTADRYPTRRILNEIELHPAPLITHAIHRETGRELWLSVTATPVFADDGTLQMAVSVSEDITRIKRAEKIKGVLARTGDVLAASLDPDQALQELAQVAVPELADWCSVSLPGEDGVIHNVALAHRDPGKVAFARDYSRRFPARTSDPAGAAGILRGEPGLLIEVTDELLEASITDPEQLEMLRGIGMRSVILAPISTPSGERIGVLSLVTAESLRRFDEDDLELAIELGRRAGVAIENARLYERQAATAAVLQRSLMPAEIPKIQGFEAHAIYRPAGPDDIVGGDFYDAFRVAGGWTLLVGDIAGKGIQAAALTAQARHVLRSNTMFTGDVVQAVTHLNRLLVADEKLSLCTICAVVLPDDPGESPARVLCAGHPRPILVRNGTTTEVGNSGPLVGAFQNSVFGADEVALSRGDLLVLYTDGLTDTRGVDGRLGSERLHEILAAARSPRDAIEIIDAEITRFQHGPQADDTAVVAIQRVAGPDGQ